MKRFELSLLILLLLFAIACNQAAKADENKESEKNTVSAKPEKSEPAIATDLKLSFEAELGKSAEGKVFAIKIKETSSGEAKGFQIIESLDLPFEEGNPACAVEFVDLNFDGLVDMKYPESIGNANIYYAYWLYDKENLQFVRNTDMDLCLPTIDTENKIIISQERGSAAQYTVTNYEYIDGKVVKTKIEDRTYHDEKTYDAKIQEWQADGSYKVTTLENVESVN